MLNFVLPCLCFNSENVFFDTKATPTVLLFEIKQLRCDRTADFKL